MFYLIMILLLSGLFRPRFHWGPFWGYGRWYRPYMYTMRRPPIHPWRRGPWF